MTNQSKSEGIVNSIEPIVLVGAGHVTSKDLSQSLSLATKLVAADGGAARALAAGCLPDAVIGDMDSVPDDKRLAGRLHPVPEQDSTDFAKAVSRIDAPLILAVGFSGGRVDHALAVLTGLAHHSDRRVIVLNEESVVFLAPPQISLPVEPGTVVSLWPLARVQGRSEGLRWPIEGLDFAPDGQIGTSNEALGPVELTFEGPGMLVILPRAAFELAVTALLSAPGRWPARAG